MGRTSCIIHLLFEAQKTYKIIEPTTGVDRCATPNPGHPVFAPPVLKHGTFHLSQTSAILQYLGHQHGIAPTNPQESANCNQANLDAADVMVEWGNLSKATDNGDAWFAPDGRLSQWLDHFSRIIAKNGGPFLFGNNITYADFGLLCALDFIRFKYESRLHPLLTERLLAWGEAMEVRSSTKLMRGLELPRLPDSFK